MHDFNIKDMIYRKAKNNELSRNDIDQFVDGCVYGTIQECQIGAMLMAMYLNDLNEDETLFLTEAFIKSGKVLEWKPEWKALLTDKHSTGGVGDKITIVLTPALAACGLKVPTLSGKGLGLTGGTLDKLQSIPGFNIQCSEEVLNDCLESAGCFISGTTDTICPADRILYGIRDVTGTVDNDSLTIASILGKKYAEGVKHLILDVKVGNGGNFSTVKQATVFAQKVKSVAQRLGLHLRVLLSAMNSPIGWTVGNALEIEESICCLRGNGCPRLKRLIAVLGGNLLQMAANVATVAEGETAILTTLANGSALKHFHDMLICQAVSPDYARVLCYNDVTTVLPSAKQKTYFKTNRAGWITEINAHLISKICSLLGAGRMQTTDNIDMSAGVKLLRHIGDRVECAENWIEVHHNDELSPHVYANIDGAIVLTDAPIELTDIVIDVL